MEATTGDTQPIDHMGLVAEMARDFADSGDIDVTLERGVARIADALGAQGASLFLLSEDGDKLVCRACTGPVDLTGLELPGDSGIVGRTVRTARTQLVQNVEADPDFWPDVDNDTGIATRSIVCAPMSVNARRLGAIELVNKTGGGHFTTNDANLLEALASAAALSVINARLTAEMVERETLRRELDLAASIQRAFLPTERAAEFPVHGHSVPARHISGDCYDIVERPDGRVWFCVADVAGKGVNAALVMAKTASLFRHLAKTAEEPGELLAALNRELCETATHGVFVTAVAGVFDPTGATARVANAGHIAGLVVGGDRAGPALEAQVQPLGIDPAALDGLRGETIDLRGRRLYVASDGVTEALADRGDPDGIANLRAAIAEAEATHAAPDARIAAAMARASPASGPPRDDLTLLTVAG